MEDKQVKNYRRRITPIERTFTRAAFSVVTLIARIKGNITEKMLKNAALKVQQRHQLLRVRIQVDENDDPWFTSEDVGEIPIEIVPRTSEEDWIKISMEASKVPFKFNKGPLIRFTLVQSASISELIISCFHIICDGMSLAYLARDIMVYLSDPNKKVEILPDEVPISQNNMPEEMKLNFFFKWILNRMNKKWAEEKIIFNLQDHEVLNEAYWNKFHHQILAVELSEAETTTLVEKCRKEEVTVNSALVTAFQAAQYMIQGNKPYHSLMMIAGNVRNRLPKPASEGMGFYASAIDVKSNYNLKKNLWENARVIHKKLISSYTNKNFFRNFLFWCYLDPTLMESRNFKILGHLIPSNAPNHNKIFTFSQRQDQIFKLLKRNNMDSIENIIVGFAVTNLTRLDFPKTYGTLELDRLILNPGGGFPLAMINLVIGAVTCSGKLSLVLEYEENIVDTKTMKKIKEKAIELLF